MSTRKRCHCDVPKVAGIQPEETCCSAVESLESQLRAADELAKAAKNITQAHTHHHSVNETQHGCYQCVFENTLSAYESVRGR